MSFRSDVVDLMTERSGMPRVSCEEALGGALDGIEAVLSDHWAGKEIWVQVIDRLREERVGVRARGKVVDDGGDVA